MVEAGDAAPDFIPPDQDGNEIDLAGLKGKIARAFPKVSPKTHDDVVLKALSELTA